MPRHDVLIDDILKFNVTGAAMIDATKIRYSAEFRRLCEQNKCGHYGKNWMCPPAVGSYEDLTAKASRYTWCLVFQTVHQLSHSRYRKALREAFKGHDESLNKIIKHLRDRYSIEEILPLGAGPCTYCEECASRDGETCRFPDRAVASLESHGIDVGALMNLCGMPYKFEQHTTTLVGAVFFNT